RDSKGLVEKALVEPFDVGFKGGLQASTPPLPSNPTFRRSSNLSSISCAGSSFCVALSPDGDLVETLHQGVWKPTAGVPFPRGESPSVARASVQSVSCGSPGFCVAVGEYTNARGIGVPLIETLSSSSWHASSGPVPADARLSRTRGASLSGVSCSTTDFCVAVGRYSDKRGATTGLIETFKKGKWIPAGAPSVRRLTDVSCPVRYTCMAVGEASNGSQPIVERLAASIWLRTSAPADPHAISGSSHLRVISCSTTWSCVAGGDYRKRSDHQLHGFVEQLTGGAWSPEEIPSPGGGFIRAVNAVECSSPKLCRAVGVWSTPHHHQRGFLAVTGIERPTAAALSHSLSLSHGGAWFGATVSHGSRQTPEAFTALQRRVNRGLDIDRDYSIWDNVQPSAQVLWDVSHGVIPLLSIDPVTSSGARISWSSIANGSQDATISAQAEALASLHTPVLLSFAHEPDLNAGPKTPAGFVAAWKHYVTVFREHGADKVSFVLILLASTYGRASIAPWYPGNAYVDWVGADGYNGFGCFGNNGPWESFKKIFSPLNSFAVAHHKPAAVAEWASTEDPRTPGRKAQWITAAANTIKSWPQIKATSYYDAPSQLSGCRWPLTSSSSAMQAFASVGAAPYFKTRPAAIITANPSTGAAPLAVRFDLSATHGVRRALSSWELNFGDGSTPAAGAGAPPPFIRHHYEAGVFTATLGVTDDTGQYDVISLGIVAKSPPSVASLQASPLSGSRMKLSGSISPNGLRTGYRFEFGQTAALGSRSAQATAGAGMKHINVSILASHLKPGTTYYWRLVASNAAGSAIGTVQSFTTAG
ncbi:MAG: hypothetical protein J2P57_00850, partial [Acidimicrobiaceae bacterium]|nr:hypothetical protein [Acidimicrobiaceae bacterium]